MGGSGDLVRGNGGHLVCGGIAVICCVGGIAVICCVGGIAVICCVGGNSSDLVCGG